MIADVKVTIGGKPAEVVSATLVRGRSGVYEVLAVIPNGLTPDDAAPVTIAAENQVSPTVTIAVQ